MSADKRVKFIDVAKGISILCIILGHLNEPGINRVVFTFHVPIFYFITGYFLNGSTPLRPFLRRKAQTLLVPYAAACVLIILLSPLCGLLFHTGESVRATLLRWIYASIYGAGDSYTAPFYIPHIGALWFLLATFWGSLFLRLTAPFRPGTRIALILAMFAAGYWSRELYGFPFSIQAGLCAVLFMYFGQLFRELREPLRGLSVEVKAAASLLAFGVWICFMRDFQSFWLVHSDVGRGAVDIMGCICGSWMVLLLSRFIENKCRRLTNALSYLGRYSIMVLFAHIIELDLFYWDQILAPVMSLGIPDSLYLYVKIAAKFLWCILVTLLLSHWDPARRLFGMPALKKKEVSA